MLDKIAAIYFDLDNTLIDRNAAHLACVEQFFDSHLPHLFFGNERFELEQNDNSGYTDRKEFCEWFIQHYQPQGWDESSFWNYMQTNIGSYVPLISDDLKIKLLQLKKRYKTGIITNGSTGNQCRKIRQASLQAIFPTETIYISQQHSVSKPDRAFFQIVLDDLQLPPSKLLYVGDDPMNDILGASQLGIQTCWLSHNRVWSQAKMPSSIIEDISMILDVVST